MKYSSSLSLLMLLFSGQTASAQDQPSITLGQAQEWALKNYPMVKQRDLVKQTAAISIDNLSKGYLPQINISGQASYQSEVTSVDIPIPNVKINPLSRDQYKVVADISQLLYDGGNTRNQKNLQEINAGVESQQVEVELYKLRDRVNQVYLGILYVDEQLKQVDLVSADIENGIRKVKAQVDNGVAFRSNLNLLQAELLKNRQRGIELKASRKGLIEVLALLTGKDLSEKTRLETPAISLPSGQVSLMRPELQLYSIQDRFIKSQGLLIESRDRPKASIFLQGGYGRPGLNFLKNQFQFWSIGGIRLNWNLGGLYTRKKEKDLVEINRQKIALQKETFILNTNTSLKQQEAEIEKWNQLAETDLEIIALRVSVKEAARAQLENGVITASDYLREVNAEDQARLSLITHQLQLLQAEITWQTLSGNL